MMNAQHSNWTDQLSDYVNGDLADVEREAVDTHLAECPACRAVLDELRAVVAGAGILGDVAPERDLWPGIAAALGASARPPAAEVIELPTAARGRPRRSGLFLTVPQLAAASVTLAIVSAAATWWVGPGLATMADAPEAGAATASTTDATAVFPVAEAPGPTPELAAELLRLEASLSAARGRLEPNTIRILEKNLGVIERAIDESRRALALDPNNGFLRDHLDRTYREKADYLREAARIADWTG
jgi:hypothetical protein